MHDIQVLLEALRHHIFVLALCAGVSFSFHLVCKEIVSQHPMIPRPTPSLHFGQLRTPSGEYGKNYNIH